MKIFETVFRLLAFLPHVATKQKEIVMSKNKKKNHSESITYKKVENFGAHFPFSGNLPHVKRKNFSGGFSDFQEFTLWKEKE